MFYVSVKYRHPAGVASDARVLFTCDHPKAFGPFKEHRDATNAIFELAGRADAIEAHIIFEEEGT